MNTPNCFLYFYTMNRDIYLIFTDNNKPFKVFLISPLLYYDFNNYINFQTSPSRIPTKKSSHNRDYDYGMQSVKTVNVNRG